MISSHLKSEGLLLRFDKPEDIEKELAKYPLRELKRLQREYQVFTVASEQDDRDLMENLLKQTHGVGSTYFSFDSFMINGLWVMDAPNEVN